jgi:hypothetical protein
MVECGYNGEKKCNGSVEEGVIDFDCATWWGSGFDGSITIGTGSAGSCGVRQDCHLG